MAYPKLQALAEQSPKAANIMVAEIARGVYAGNDNMVPQVAAKLALETAEEILVQLAPDNSRVAAFHVPDDTGDDD